MIIRKFFSLFILTSLFFYSPFENLSVSGQSDDHIRILSLDGQKELKSLSNELISLLPSGHLPECNVFKMQRIAVHDFSKSLLPIRSKSGYDVDLIDNKGNIVHNIKKYDNVGFLEDGYYLCYDAKYNHRRRKNDSYYNYTYAYLNESFEEVFEDRKFSFATSFTDGKALVQEDGQLYIIDLNGVNIDTLPEHLSKHFSKAWKIVKDVCKIMIKIPKNSGKGFHYITEYYDTKREQIIRGSDGKYFGSEIIFPSENGVSYDNGGIKMFDKSGQILKTITNVDLSYFSVRYRSNSEFFVYRDTNKVLHLMDKNLNEVTISGKSINNYKFIHINKSVVCVSEKLDQGPYIACDPKTLEVLGQTDFPVFGAVENHLILGYHKMHNYYFKGIQKGNQVVSIGNDKYWYTNFKDGLKEPELVINLDLMLKDFKEFPQLSLFKNLKKLKLNRSSFESFNIDFAKLEALEELEIRIHSKLKQLPESLKNHPSLKVLSIDFSPNISNIEQIVTSLPQLEELYLSGLELSESIVKELEVQNKKIKISVTEAPEFEDTEIGH